MAAIAQALARLDEQPPLVLHVDRVTAWAVLCQLQLAQLHPASQGPLARAARELGHLLEAAVATDEPLKTLARQGWHLPQETPP